MPSIESKLCAETTTRVSVGENTKKIGETKNNKQIKRDSLLIKDALSFAKRMTEGWETTYTNAEHRLTITERLR